MPYTPPKLVEILISQTPRAMIAMVIVSFSYFWAFLEYVPVYILFLWLTLQLLLAVFRFYNIKKFRYSLDSKDFEQVRRNEIHFTISNIFQAGMWTIASILSCIYAPQPFELVTFVMIIGIITAAVLSMSSIYKAYLVFFFCMIIPQIIILALYGEHQHIFLIVLTLIYIPATILLSKTIYNSRLSSIETKRELEESIEKLHSISITDSLTKAYNRRYFFEVSKNIISTALRDKNEVSLIMLDVDFFKKINDKYGHQAGDRVLENLVESINKIIRESDILARIGGEEFSILLNNTSKAGAKVIAEKIRSFVESHKITYHDKSIEITVSLGVSTMCSEVDSMDKLYKEADSRLYIAKRSGRNRVIDNKPIGSGLE